MSEPVAPRPQFSVVVPLYNKESYVERSLRSALEQTCSDLEIVVVDDGSTDGGPRVVGGLADPRIRLIRQANGGVSAARNRGIAEARGRLVAFLDADDQWLPTHLEVLQRLVRQYPEAGLYATAYLNHWKEGLRPAQIAAFDGQTEGEGILPSYFRAACDGIDPPVWTSTVAVPREVLDEIGCFPTGFRSAEDLDVWIRIALRYPVAFSGTPTAIYVRTSNTAANKYFPEEEQLLARWASYQVGPPPVDFHRYLARKKLDIVRKCILEGRRAKARELLDSLPAGLWQRQRKILVAASYLPGWFLGTYVGLKHLLRRLR